MSAGLTFVINLVVLMVVLAAHRHAARRSPAVCFPLLLVDLVLLTLGTALLLAPLYVRYRDVGYLWSIVLQVGFWLTPIIYLDLMVPEQWRWIVWVNPVGRIIGDSRRALIYGWWPGAARPGAHHRSCRSASASSATPSSVACRDALVEYL